MRAGEIDLLDIQLPITLRPSAPVSDEDPMRFSEQNKPFKVERNKEGDLTIMTPVGGIGSTHEFYRLVPKACGPGW